MQLFILAAVALGSSCIFLQKRAGKRKNCISPSNPERSCSKRGVGCSSSSSIDLTDQAGTQWFLHRPQSGLEDHHNGIAMTSPLPVQWSIYWEANVRTMTIEDLIAQWEVDARTIFTFTIQKRVCQIPGSLANHYKVVARTISGAYARSLSLAVDPRTDRPVVGDPLRVYQSNRRLIQGPLRICQTTSLRGRCKKHGVFARSLRGWYKDR